MNSLCPNISTHILQTLFFYISFGANKENLFNNQSVYLWSFPLFSR